MNAWSEYVHRVADGLTQTQIATKAGLAQSAVSRWVRGETDAPRAEFVVTFARAFHQNPVEALVIAGYVTAEEAGAVTQIQPGRTPLRDFKNDELVVEIRRRMVDEPTDGVHDEGYFAASNSEMPGTPSPY